MYFLVGEEDAYVITIMNYVKFCAPLQDSGCIFRTVIGAMKSARNERPWAALLLYRNAICGVLVWNEMNDTERGHCIVIELALSIEAAFFVDIMIAKLMIRNRAWHPITYMKYEFGAGFSCEQSYIIKHLLDCDGLITKSSVDVTEKTATVSSTDIAIVKAPILDVLGKCKATEGNGLWKAKVTGQSTLDAFTKSDRKLIVVKSDATVHTYVVCGSFCYTADDAVHFLLAEVGCI